MTHPPYRSWCKVCPQARPKHITAHIDTYTQHEIPVLPCVDVTSGMASTCVVPQMRVGDYPISELRRFVMDGALPTRRSRKGSSSATMLLGGSRCEPKEAVEDSYGGFDIKAYDDLTSGWLIMSHASTTAAQTSYERRSGRTYNRPTCELAGAALLSDAPRAT